LTEPPCSVRVCVAFTADRPSPPGELRSCRELPGGRAGARSQSLGPASVVPSHARMVAVGARGVDFVPPSPPQCRRGTIEPPVPPITLDNMFRTYREKPRAERPQYLRHCVRAATSHLRTLPGDFEAARPDLRPKLWMRAMLEQQRLRARLGEPAAPDLPSEPI